MSQSGDRLSIIKDFLQKINNLSTNQPPDLDVFELNRKPSSFFDCLLEVLVRYMRSYPELHKVSTFFRDSMVEFLKGLFGPSLVCFRKGAKRGNKGILMKKLEPHLQKVCETICDTTLEQFRELKYSENDVKELTKLFDTLIDLAVSSLFLASSLITTGIPVFSSRISRRNPLKILEGLIQLSNYVHSGCCSIPLQITSQVKVLENEGKIFLVLLCPLCSNKHEVCISIPKPSLSDKNADQDQQHEDNDDELLDDDE